MAENMAAMAAMKGKLPEEPMNYVSQAAPGIQNEKRALLALLAEKGTEGYAEWERQKAQAGAARAATLEQAAARGAAVNVPETLNAELTQNYDNMIGGYSDTAVQAQMSHGREMDRIQAANAAYMDQMTASIPNLSNEMGAEIEKMRLAYEFALEQLKLEAAEKGKGGGGGRGRGGRGGRGGGGGGDGMPMFDMGDDFFAGSQDLDGSYQRNEDRRFEALRPKAPAKSPITRNDRSADDRLRARTGQPTRRGITNNDRSADRRLASRVASVRAKTGTRRRNPTLAEMARYGPNGRPGK